MIFLVGLLIPIAFSILLALKYREQAVWWEYVVMFASYFAFIGIFYGAIYMADAAANDYEYHTDHVVKLRYYEDWNEYIHRTCTRTHTNHKGATYTTTYDCSYVQYHPEYWVAILSGGMEMQISQSTYNRILGFLEGRPQFVELGRGYYTNDGDLWESDYPNGGKLWPMTYTEHYTNQVKAHQASIFHYREIESDEARKLGLYDYPEINTLGQQPVILGGSSKDAYAADYNLRRTNSVLGPQVNVQSYVLIFKNKPISISFDQEAYWQGGNRNELVVCIGIDDQRNVKWSRVFSWTPNQQLKLKIRDSVLMMQELKLSDLSQFLDREIAQDWILKDFSDFDYLEYELSTTSIIIIFLLTLLCNGLVCLWVVKNEWYHYIPNQIRIRRSR